MIKAISFDYDWTLVETRPHTYEICQNVLTKFGYKYSLKTIKERFVETIEGLPKSLHHQITSFAHLSLDDQRALIRSINRERLRNLGVSHKNLEVCLQVVEYRIQVQQKHVLYEDVQDTLEQLTDRNIALYVISGNTYSHITSILNEYNVSSFFQEVLTPNRCGMLKRQIFSLLPKKTGLSARLILHVGDHEQDDIAAASSHGLETILIRRPLHYYQKIVNNTTPVINGLTKLLEIL